MAGFEDLWQAFSGVTPYFPQPGASVPIPVPRPVPTAVPDVAGTPMPIPGVPTAPMPQSPMPYPEDAHSLGGTTSNQAAKGDKLSALQDTLRGVKPPTPTAMPYPGAVSPPRAQAMPQNMIVPLLMQLMQGRAENAAAPPSLGAALMGARR